MRKTIQKLTICLLSGIGLLYFYSCRKTDLLSYHPTPKETCRLTEISDVAALGDYDLIFTYDANGRLTYTSGANISYDSMGRLARLDYGDNLYRQYTYDGRSSLPSSSQFYSNNKYSRIINYHYDNKNRFVTLDFQSIGSIRQKVIWQFHYNQQDNADSITLVGQKTAIYTAIKYDDKPNFANSNPWIKYILFNPEEGYFLLPYLLFNRNNATEWALNDQSTGLIFPAVNSYYQYNESGWAISDSTVFHDPVNGDFSDTQIHTFDCSGSGSINKTTN